VSVMVHSLDHPKKGGKGCKGYQFFCLQTTDEQHARAVV
jgi:hypothetical protein